MRINYLFALLIGTARPSRIPYIFLSTTIAGFIYHWVFEIIGTKLMVDLLVFAVSSLAGSSFGAFVGTIVFDKYKTIRHIGNKLITINITIIMIIFIHFNSLSPR